ncbi:MAG: 16S rRNA (adenine(1518)-N(6)/adenine(1519)-N(6))-dimethyltransferase [Bacteroidetes bacterium RIFCSPLOWO2_12_FULL_35_15]|nr:MAG: 16S rRNA (adenine(1518)-N(6)/adenine(1519)-N(6))-dimethyltransferase [Bacteroidetes bacterium RIFCSPLOWO2_12_FULL_35_15]
MTKEVRAKKHLGQHFLKDETIALNIVKSLKHTSLYKKVLEVGPGMGVLTKYLITEPDFETHIIDIDWDSIAYLKKHFPVLENRIIEGDFLKLDFNNLFDNESFAVIGNFPYNISTEILFKVLDHKNQVPEVVGMFQKEVAERIASKPRNKTYGITSVLLQAFYDIEYLFTVNENVFDPPPRVKSAVIRLTRNEVQQLDCNEKLFKQVVKAGFNQRRKTLRNSIKAFKLKPEFLDHKYLTQRAEELSVADFVALTNMVEV